MHCMFFKGYKCTESVSNQYEVLRNEYALTLKAGRIYRLSNYLRADLFFDVGAGYFSTKTKGKIEGIPNPVNFNVFEGVIWEFDEKLNGIIPVMSFGISIGYYLN